MKPRLPSRPTKAKRLEPVLLTAAEAKREQAKQLVIDVQPQRFMTHILPGAQRLNVDIALGDIDRNQPVLITCLTGARSLKAAGQLINRGYRQVYVLKDGLAAWQRAGYTLRPIKVPS